MYGGFGFMRGGNDIFEKDNITLEDVLDDEQSEFCLDAPNEKCKEFFTERQLKSLVNYIIKIPENDKDKKTAFKYPFMASKLLSSKSSLILDFFFKNEKEAENRKDSYDQFEADVLLVDENIENQVEGSKNEEEKGYEINQENLDFLFKFLEIDDEINYVLSGYFSKAVTSFITGDTKTNILEYFYKKESHHSEHLIKHIYCKSIATLLSQFLNFSKMSDDKNNSLNLGDIGFGSTFNLRNGDETSKKTPEKEVVDEFSENLVAQRVDIYKTLINRLFASTDLEVLSNIRDVFLDFFKDSEEISLFQKVFEGVFFDQNTIDTLFKCLYLRGSRNNTKVGLISKIFAQALRHLHKIDAEKDMVIFEIQDNLRNSIIENMPSLVKVVNQTLEAKTIQTSTFGREGLVLGTKVIAIYDLFLGFLKLGDEGINEAVAESGLLQLSMDIFYNFPWNNIYHCTFIKLLKFYLESEAGSKLFNQVTDDSRLAKFILKAYQRTTVSVKVKKISTKNLGYGYTGFLREIGNKVLALEDGEKKDMITKSDEWEEFVNTHLTKVNKFLSKERDDVFKIVEKKESWMGGDFDDDIMNELNNTIGGGIFGDSNKDKDLEGDDQEEEDFMSEESEPGSILNAIQKNHLQEQDDEEYPHDNDYNWNKHFSSNFEPSAELIDSLLEEIEN